MRLCGLGDWEPWGNWGQEGQMLADDCEDRGSQKLSPKALALLCPLPTHRGRDDPWSDDDPGREGNPEFILGSLVSLLCCSFCFVCFLLSETGFHHVALAGLELAM